MKILLVHPPWLKFFGSSISTPPIALYSIASYIRRELPQIDIDVYNADYSDSPNLFFNSHMFATMQNEYLERLNNLHDPIWQEVKKTISNYSPDILGISAMTASYVSGLKISIIAKHINPKMVVVFGGKHPTSLPEDTLKNASVDFIVIGEGEETFKNLILNINSPKSVKGIAYKNHKGEVLRTLVRQTIADINKLPIPILQSSINTYGFEKNINLEAIKWNIISARGCPFQCIYCASEKEIRYRRPQNVIEEVKLVKQKYGINYFSFQDDSFSINKKRALELCDLLKRENVIWDCNTRVDLIDKNLFFKMKQSGCREVSIGIESGSKKTLKIIRKKIDFEQIFEAVHLLKKYKFITNGFFMIGFPWENREDMEKTLDLIKRLPIDNFELNIATPLPGTQMFRSLVEAGKININTEDWSRYHQGSPKMNFSQYSNAKWEEIILDLIYKAAKIQKKMFIKRNLKTFLQDPVSKTKRIGKRIRGSIHKYF
ncbi:hypothetical protein C6A37_00380 [Desulfobacteraceae bacterium SEEP-SAG9]|nr:hypothetical protein C6A37_00380 [Desulfobacteraceae bacterium SEEP-SAG9]